MIKKILLSYAWMLLTAGMILVGIGAYNFVYLGKQPLTAQTPPTTQLGSAVSIAEDKTDYQRDQIKGVESIVETDDGRAAIVTNFLKKYNSPLKPHDKYGQILVEIADQYQLDFRLLPAIMMQESNLCKNIPAGSYNCLGFGIHSGGTLGFDTYKQGFERAAKEIRANYVEEGRLTVAQIAKKYTASVESWTSSVNQWMAEMKYDDRQKGLERKTDANVLEFARKEDGEDE